MCFDSRWVPVIIGLFIWTLSTRGKITVSGDEPHYLIIAESLLADRDLNLANNYAQNDGRRFGADGLTSGAHARPNRAGALWSVHDIGVPVLFLPVYAVATRLAARAPESLLARFHQTRGLFAFSLLGLTLIAMTVWATWLLLRGMDRVAAQWSGVVVLVLALSPPVLPYAMLLFPETPAFAVICAVVWLVCLSPDERTRWRVTAVIAAVGLLPWLHRKYVFFVFGLAFLIAWTYRVWLVQQPRRVWVALGGLLVLPQLALHIWTVYEWGNLGGPHMLDYIPFSLAWLPRGGLGMIFDRERGLLGYAPVYVLIPACWALTWRQSWPLAVPIMSLFLPLAAFVSWDGGFSPAARFLVPITPLLILPVASAMRYSVVRWSAVPLLILQAMVTLLAWWHPPDLWPREQGTNRIFDKIPVIGRPYEYWLPSILTGDSLAQGWICVATLSILTTIIVLAARRVDATRAAKLERQLAD
jgi:hypothetical protein